MALESEGACFGFVHVLVSLCVPIKYYLYRCDWPINEVGYCLFPNGELLRVFKCTCAHVCRSKGCFSCDTQLHMIASVVSVRRDTDVEC